MLSASSLYHPIASALDRDLVLSQVTNPPWKFKCLSSDDNFIVILLTDKNEITCFIRSACHAGLHIHARLCYSLDKVQTWTLSYQNINSHNINNFKCVFSVSSKFFFNNYVLKITLAM